MNEAIFLFNLGQVAIGVILLKQCRKNLGLANLLIGIMYCYPSFTLHAIDMVTFEHSSKGVALYSALWIEHVVFVLYSFKEIFRHGRIIRDI